MKCARCMGAMIEDHLHGLEGPLRELWAFCWRCQRCGYISDRLISQNLAGGQKIMVRLSIEPDYMDEEVHLGAESFIGRTA